jgi:hypothetical protein
VLKEHVVMLGDAGVNTLILDNTNGVVYPNTQAALFRALAEMQKLGTRVPKFTCFTGLGAWNSQFRNIYTKGIAKRFWYRWGGRPLMLVNHKVGTLPKDIRRFFTLRRCWAAEFPYKRDVQPWFGNGKNKWTWIEYYPQPCGWHVSPQLPEEISVAAGGWAVSDMARDYHDGYLPPRRDQNPDRGVCFAEQWHHALKRDPAFIFVTSWNEWTAESWYNASWATPPSPMGHFRMVGHRTKTDQPIYIDGFDEEYSRDIEPMKGGFGDDYYYQLVANIRRYKGVHPLSPIHRTTIHIMKPFAQWQNVSPLFVNNVGLAVHRDYQGWGNGPVLPVYKNNTGRNDIAGAKVCYDAKNIYFWVRTRKAITSWKDPNWMLLFLNSTGNPHKGWLGYNYVIDRKVLNDHTTTLQRNIGGQYQWKTVGTVQYRVKGDQMEVAVPRKLLGLAGKLPPDIHFKWADNIQQTGQWSDFYLNGDCAPPFRFYYRAKFRSRAPHG